MFPVAPGATAVRCPLQGVAARRCCQMLVEVCALEVVLARLLGYAARHVWPCAGAAIKSSAMLGVCVCVTTQRSSSHDPRISPGTPDDVPAS